MEKKIKLGTEISLILLNLVPLLVTLLFWNRIPAQVPVHWNFSGEIDGYGPKWMVPLMNVGLYLLFLLVMFIDPKKENYQKFRRTFNKIRWVLSIFFVIVSSVTVMIALNYEINMERFLLISLPLLFSLIGNFMLNIKPNWFLGIRTPWTLSSDEVWRKTHRLAGILWFWAGLVCLITSFFVTPTIGFYILVSVIGTVAMIPFVYSFIAFRQEKQHARENNNTTAPH